MNHSLTGKKGPSGVYSNMREPVRSPEGKEGITDGQLGAPVTPGAGLGP